MEDKGNTKINKNLKNGGFVSIPTPILDYNRCYHRRRWYPWKSFESILTLKVALVSKSGR